MATLTGTQSEFWRTVFSAGTYKPGQGQMMRNGTLVALLVLIVTGIYSWSNLFPTSEPGLKWGFPVALGAIMAWVSFRLVHYPRFADFLVTTEAEVAKVKWPSWPEVRAATWVIIVNMLIMAIFLFVVDTFWKFVLGEYFLGILKIGGLFGSGGQGM